MVRKSLALFLSFLTVIVPVVAAAGPQIPGFYGSVPLPSVVPTALPVAKNGGVLQGVRNMVSDPATNQLLINQGQPRAIIDWQSFNIGANAWVRFDQQKNTDWIALNRIFDANPSQIYGKLTADGKIYLINRNGILFGPGSQVNVHSLVASSLNLKTIIDDPTLVRFLDPTQGVDLHFLDDGSGTAAPGVVANHGAIETDTLGSAFLIGPQVENGGTITSPAGQIGLIAGTDVSLQPDTASNTTRSALVVSVNQTPGGVRNFENGQLVTESGVVGMYGREVRQDGLIRAVTAIKRNGQVELLATDRIATGAASVTETPVTDSPERLDESFVFTGGGILLGGLAAGVPVKVIEHHGVITAPAGTVTLDASDRVFLETGSRIDVSGIWNEKTASEVTISTQLNSVALRDAHGQKDGVLQGATVQVDPRTGSAIGDISGALASQQRSARERSTAGGIVSINALAGDILLKQGAAIDFAGGGTRYDQGNMGTTKLLSGNRVVDISGASGTLSYSKVLGDEKTQYRRFGVTEEFQGLYYGGGAPIKDFVSRFVEGSDAGSVRLEAKKVVLDGDLNGRVDRGLYQILATDPVDSLGRTKARGLAEPVGGSLILGKTRDNPVGNDQIVNEVAVVPQTTPLPPDFGPDGPANLGTTYLSAKTLNAAGLSRIELNANSRVTIADGASVTLQPGGAFTATARRIEQHGGIAAPSGSVTLTTKDNITTSAENAADSRIFLAGGSRIDVAGEKVDNSRAARGNDQTVAFGHVNGGTVDIKDRTDHGDGVILQSGAAVDVSGGYTIDRSGNVSGGDAGTALLQGSTLILDGEMKGLSLPGKNGGRIVLHAKDVAVTPSAAKLPDDFRADSVLPADRNGKLLLAGNRLDATGFTRIELKSQGNVTVDDGAFLSPSAAKMPVPLPGGASAGPNGVPTNSYFLSGDSSSSVTASPAFLGSSAVRLSADAAFEGNRLDGTGNLLQDPNPGARIDVAHGAGIRAGVGGTIDLQGPGVTLSGLLEAPSGTIGVRASQYDLVVNGGSRILAEGVDISQATAPAKGLPPNATPLPGGSVALEATNASLSLAPGSLVSVRGAPPVETFVGSVDDALSSLPVGSDAGSVSLAAAQNLTMDGTLQGNPLSAGWKGGSLLISRKNDSVGLAISPDRIRRFAESGFDALTFISRKSIDFTGPMNATVGRSLTLDAPAITASGQDLVSLQAPWIRLINGYLPPGTPATAGGAQLELKGDWVDAEGSTLLSGFGSVLLEAKHDLRLSDRQYGLPTGPVSVGSLGTGADLTLKAARIYPTTQSDYTINTAGKVTTLPGDAPDGSPIYSSGGSLTVNAAGGIEHRGVLAAPFGSISFNKDPNQSRGSRVYLAEGSLLTTRGDGSVNYGFLDADQFNRVADKSHPGNAQGVIIDGAPEKSVDLNGSEVIVKSGARIDVSGGGSVFAYQFQPGIEGSVNPLSVQGRYVIVPDGSVKLPGAAVYLSGGYGVHGVPAGIYSLLPAEFAFLPGAMVIADVGTTVIPGKSLFTSDGFPVVGGYKTVMGTDIRSPILKGFSIRSAKDVLKEGNFTVKTFQAGDAGAVSLRGDTTILNGTVEAAALAGYKGGTLALSGKNVIVQPNSVSLPTDFGFGSAVPVGLQGTLFVDSTTVSGKGLQEIRLGNIDSATPANSTATVTLKAGSSIDAPVVTFAARDAITLESGAQVNAVDTAGGGVATLTTQGKATIQANAQLHASDKVALDVGAIDFSGGSPIRVDHSELSLQGSRIFFVPDGFATDHPDLVQGNPGLYLTDSIWNSLSGVGNIALKSRSDLLFEGDFDLRLGQTLRIDAGRIGVLAPGGNGIATVSLGAPKIALSNTGGAPAGPTLANTGVMNVSATELSVEKGDILFDGLSALNFNSAGDFTSRGAGSVTTGGDLSITAARVTTSNYAETGLPYQAADFRINTPNGLVTLGKGTGAPGTTSIPGGSLEIDARRIDQGGVLVVDAGRVTLNAVGTAPGDGIVLRSGSEIAARGIDPPPGIFGGKTGEPGGRVALRTAAGPIAMETGSLIDVSAGAAGDAGGVTFSASGGSVTLQGDLRGQATAGRGGSFTLDTDRVADFSSLNGMLSARGFTGLIDVRARTGNLTVGAEDTVRAGVVRLAADGGDIDLRGFVDASGSHGGMVEMFARNGLTLRSGSRVAASGTAAGGAGGEVLLSSANGLLDMASGSTVDVSGGAGGTGGTVSFRAKRAASDVNMNLNGTVTGASRSFAEAFQVYQAGSIDAMAQNAWLADTNAYMTNAGVVRDRLLTGLAPNGLDPAAFHFLPGIEVQSQGNLTLASPWDLTSARFGGEPGVLTLRAAGDLVIANPLVDHPTPMDSLNQPGTRGRRDSWAINLAAGSDLGGADPLAVMRGSGTLNMTSPASLVYSESAPIRFASGGDTVLGSGTNPNYMITITPNFKYTLASYDGGIRGAVNGNLVIADGAIQTATGGIDLTTGGDLNLVSAGGNALGSIRTTGEHSSVPNAVYSSYAGKYWEYADGGDISLDIGKAVKGGLANNAWDAVKSVRSGSTVLYNWSASYESAGASEPFRGIGTLGGGSIEVRSGGDYYGQTGAFGRGDLTVNAGGDLKGRFLVKEGRGEFHTLGDFGAFQQTAPDGRVIHSAEYQVVEAFDAKIDVAAQGSIALGTVVNPTIARDGIAGQSWNLQYGEDSSVTLFARTGDVALSGATPFYSFGSGNDWLGRVLPPSLAIYAGRDIRIGNEFAMAPSPQAKLVLEAGRDIDGLYVANAASGAANRRGMISVSDISPESAFGFHSNKIAGDAVPTLGSFFDPHNHDPSFFGRRTSNLVTVAAGGDIRDLQLFLPERAEVTAGGEIRDIYYVGQNLVPDDVSSILAGKDIFFSSVTGADRTSTGIEQGGPGALVVQTGGSIDLGTTKGIQSYGNSYNVGLGTKGSSVFVAAGLDVTRNVATHIPLVEAFFDVVRADGVEYSLLKKNGDAAGAQQLLQETRNLVIDPFFGGPLTAAGSDINMVSSQISTNSGKDDIFVIATGKVNVGKSTIVLDRTQAESQLKNTGIYTAKGGAIDIFSGGDLNVNEARVMTFQGGDITAWSDRGGINAGRGSKTAISTDPPRLVKVDPNDPNSPSILVFSPPAVGSGIRTLTYATGFDETPPPAGDVYLFAPSGAIDAGEAGILGNKVVLGATQIINAANISFAVSSVGIPSAESGVSLGVLSGAGALAENSKLIEQTAFLGATSGRSSNAPAAIGENFVTRWLDVKVIGFEVPDEEAPADPDRSEKDKRKQ